MINRKILKSENGFTLIEIIAVITEKMVRWDTNALRRIADNEALPNAYA